MRTVVFLALVVGLPTLAPRPATGVPPAAAQAALHAIRQARQTCHVPTDDELARAKAEAIAAHERLSARLADLPDGRSTGDELGLPSLLEALHRPSPDLPALDGSEATLRRNRPAAEGAEYEALCSAMRHYVRLVRADLTPDLEKQYTAWMDRLETACWRYFADRSAENLAPLVEAYDWLLENGQAADALARVREQAAHPNHHARFSAALLNRLVGQAVDRPLSSDDTSDGAQVRVRGVLNGRLSSALVPDEDRGVIHVGFRGVGNSNITAVKGRATVRARGLTEITAGQPLYLSSNGLGAGSPHSAVRHRTSQSVVCLNMNCRLLRRLLTPLAAKVVRRQQAANDLKASQRTKKQIEDRLRGESARIVKQGNQTLDSLGLFAALGAHPSQTLRLRTTADYIEWLGRYADETQFASPAGPPQPAEGDHAVLFQLHESAANNAWRVVAGQTANEADFREAVYSTICLLPLDGAEAAGRIPATIAFADDDPLHVRIQAGRIVVCLRLDAIEHDGVVRRGPYRVTVSYTPQIKPAGTTIVRDGPIAIEPAELPQLDQLQAVLSRFFVAEARATANRPLAALLAPSILRARQLSLADGWLTLGLKLEEGAAGD